MCAHTQYTTEGDNYSNLLRFSVMITEIISHSAADPRHLQYVKVNIFFMFDGVILKQKNVAKHIFTSINMRMR